MITLTCNVCDKNEAVGVFASSCGAVSFAYCQECLDSDREPYGALAAYLMGASSMEDVAEWVKPIVRATLQAEGKTEEQFFQDTVAMLWGIGGGDGKPCLQDILQDSPDRTDVPKSTL